MTKSLALVVWLSLGTSAFADDAKTKDAQAKVDAAKVETCEKGKAFLVEQKGKGKCADQATEAAKVTCSATTWKAVNDLVTKCTTPPKPASAPPDKPAEPAIPKCHAVEKADATKVIAEAEDKLSTKCFRALIDKVKEAKCAEVANKGKRVAYTVQFDHVMGTGKYTKKLKDAPNAFYCPK